MAFRKAVWEMREPFIRFITQDKPDEGFFDMMLTAICF